MIINHVGDTEYIRYNLWAEGLILGFVKIFINFIYKRRHQLVMRRTSKNQISHILSLSFISRAQRYQRKRHARMRPFRCSSCSTVTQKSILNLVSPVICERSTLMRSEIRLDFFRNIFRREATPCPYIRRKRRDARLLSAKSELSP